MLSSEPIKDEYKTYILRNAIITAAWSTLLMQHRVQYTFEGLTLVFAKVYWIAYLFNANKFGFNYCWTSVIYLQQIIVFMKNIHCV